MKMEYGKYTIESDPLQFILYKNHTTKKGESKKLIVGYFSTLESLLIRLADLSVFECETENMAEMLVELRRIRVEIRAIGCAIGSNWRPLEGWGLPDSCLERMAGQQNDFRMPLENAR